ncbi:hypothetical protein DV737_g5304, partial [Chaetothyriales sp. CBS 132003]
MFINTTPLHGLGHGVSNVTSESQDVHVPETALAERRALAFFQHETAREFSGAFSGELWSRFMLLMAQHQSAVKHALVALGTLHERFVTTKDASHQGLTSEYALQHYSNAIKEVIAMRDTKREDAAEIALASCILFFCLESLRGYFQSAITHVLSGIRIINDVQKSSGPGGHHAYIPQTILRGLFLQMDSHIMEIGYNIAAGIPLADEVELCLPVCYSSSDDAMADLTIIYNLAIHLLYQAEMTAIELGAGHAKLDELKQQRARYQHKRIRWQEAFQAMLLNNATGVHARDPRCMILNVQNNALGIILSVDFVDPEMDFDQFADAFGGIVDDAEEIILRTSIITPSSVPLRSDGGGDGDAVVSQEDIMRIKTVEVTFGPESTGTASYSFMNSVEAYIERDQRGVQSFNELMTWE